MRTKVPNVRWTLEPVEERRNKDPLHGVTLERMLYELEDRYGWEELGLRVQIRCFNYEPSIGSSLAFLRKTPWARAKVEKLYVEMVRERDA